MAGRKRKSEIERIEALNEEIERLEAQRNHTGERLEKCIKERNHLLSQFIIGQMEIHHMNYAETASLIQTLIEQTISEHQRKEIEEQIKLAQERCDAEAKPELEPPATEKTVQLIVRLTATEKAQIQKNMELSHYQNFNAYAKKLLLDGYLIIWTSPETRELTKELGAVNRSLNQLVKRANATQSIYEGDFRDILRCWERIKNRVLRYLEQMRSKSNGVC